ncbi:amino acid ABC transporter substrate-binding protein, partial [Limosilactobacillus reuteri]
NLSSVSGADGGEKCESFEACKALIKDKKKIQYFGKTGIGPFNKNNDPSSANIGIFEYDGNNVNVFQDMQSGDVPTE